MKLSKWLRSQRLSFWKGRPKSKGEEEQQVVEEAYLPEEDAPPAHALGRPAGLSVSTRPELGSTASSPRPCQERRATMQASCGLPANRHQLTPTEPVLGRPILNRKHLENRASDRAASESQRLLSGVDSGQRILSGRFCQPQLCFKQPDWETRASDRVEGTHLRVAERPAAGQDLARKGGSERKNKRSAGSVGGSSARSDSLAASAASRSALWPAFQCGDRVTLEHGERGTVEPPNNPSGVRSQCIGRQTVDWHAHTEEFEEQRPAGQHPEPCRQSVNLHAHTDEFEEHQPAAASSLRGQALNLRAHTDFLGTARRGEGDEVPPPS